MGRSIATCTRFCKPRPNRAARRAASLLPVLEPLVEATRRERGVTPRRSAPGTAGLYTEVALPHGTLRRMNPCVVCMSPRPLDCVSKRGRRSADSCNVMRNSQLAPGQSILGGSPESSRAHEKRAPSFVPSMLDRRTEEARSHEILSIARLTQNEYQCRRRFSRCRVTTCLTRSAATLIAAYRLSSTSSTTIGSPRRRWTVA